MGLSRRQLGRVPSCLDGGEGHAVRKRKDHLWVVGQGGPGLPAGLRERREPGFSVSAVLGRQDSQSSWSFKVLAGSDSWLGGRPPGASMVQAFQGAMGAIFSGLGFIPQGLLTISGIRRLPEGCGKFLCC